MKNIIVCAFIVTALSACAAKPVVPGAENVMLSNEKPTDNCEFIGEITGGQGNWWTDDITSTKNVVEGSRNDLRNQAFSAGADYVHIQQTTGNSSILGGSTMGIVGNAYKCAN
jgi:hypothetical protein